MSVEYHTGYCKSCDADRKLERKTPNHILHFLITVVLGIFTYGIGSAIWIGIWFLISTKFSGWTCHVCGSKNDEPVFHHTEHNSKSTGKRAFIPDTKKEESIINKLKKSPKIIVGILVSLIVIIFLFSFDLSGENGSNKEAKKKKENVVNARVDVNEQDNIKKKDTVKDNKVDSKLCYLYDIKTKGNILSGLVNCKEGKLTIDFYDRETKSVVDTKTVTFKDNKFQIKFDKLEKVDFKFEVKLTKKQISEQKKQFKKEEGKSILSVNSDGNEKDIDASKCSIKDWNYSKYSKEYLVVDGKTTCTNGNIVLEIFDENNIRLGAESDSIESGVFSIFFKTNSNPTSISLKYTISQK